MWYIAQGTLLVNSFTHKCECAKEIAEYFTQIHWRTEIMRLFGKSSGETCDVLRKAMGKPLVKESWELSIYERTFVISAP